MLPSGNDAAQALAEWGGKTIRKNCHFLRKLRTPTDNEIKEDKNENNSKKEEEEWDEEEP